MCCWFFFHNFYSLKTIFCFFFLSICKSLNKLQKGNIIVILSCFRYSFNYLHRQNSTEKFFWDPTGKQWLTEPERMNVNKHRVFYCSKSKTIHGGMYISITKGLCTLITHIDYFLQLYLMISISLLAFFIVYVHHFIYI